MCVESTTLTGYNRFPPLFFDTPEFYKLFLTDAGPKGQWKKQRINRFFPVSLIPPFDPVLRYCSRNWSNFTCGVQFRSRAFR